MSGGKREGSGRPEGTGKYGEPTKLMRIPVSMVKDVEKMIDKLRRDSSLLGFVLGLHKKPEDKPERNKKRMVSKERSCTKKSEYEPPRGAYYPAWHSRTKQNKSKEEG